MKYLLFFVSCSLLASYFEPKKLEHKAEVEGYGYKTANLLELKNLFQKETQFKVPEFIGIPSPIIQKLLSEADLDLPKIWDRIIQRQDIASQTLGYALETKILPQHFLDPCLELAKQIKTRFANLSSAHLPELQAFLEKAKQNNWRLMIRSTGKEDTDKLANAGGNLSVGNVSPDLKTVLKAIGQVIASYFEERSLSQRLSAGDRALFDLPLTPVLIQRMIGEELNGASKAEKIPVGCVLYTEETAARLGNLYTLQCAYGHNEGVVESLVPLDTYYVQHSGDIQSILKRKTKRIVPMLENNIFGLEELNNPKEIQNKAALNKQAIALVSQAGKSIDDYYQKRMDIELVYEPWTQIVYVVQARPLVIPDSAQQPSYLTEVTSFTHQEVVPITSINPGDSAILRIQEKTQIITAKSLEAALAIYQVPSFNRPSVKAIIVTDQADPTSHAAAVFRGDSKLIFVTERFSTLESWLKANPLNLMIDTQRGLILNLHNKTWRQENLRNLFEKRVLKFGWLNYPLPLRVSVGAHQPQYCLAPQMRPETFFGEITCLNNRLENQVRELNKLTEKTKNQANCDSNKAGCLEQKALATQVLPKLENLNTHAHELMQQIRANPNQDLPELLSLFPKRFLESLVSQPAKSHIADAYSVASVKAEYAQGHNFIENTLKPLLKSQILSENILRDPELFRIAQLGHQASLTDKTTQRFLRFVDQTQDRTQLIKLVDNLEALQILPMWLNGLFMTATEEADQTEHAQGLLKKPYEWPLIKPGYGLSNAHTDKLLVGFETEYNTSKSYLEALQSKKAQMASYNLSKWSEPKAFSKTRADFQKKFETYFSSKRFLNFKTPLEKISAVSSMEQYVELFDQSIKTLKSRTDSEKVEQFKIRIQDYLNLLKTWAPKAPKKLITYHQAWELETYLTRVQDLLSAKNELQDTDLLPSQNFSVFSAALGAGTAFERHFPENLEDFFTLVHQSLNTCMGAWNTEALGNLILPADFERTWNTLKNSGGFPLYLTGIRVGNGFITYSINMPLQNHSGKLELNYHTRTDSTNLTFYFLSDARERWSLIRDYTLLKSEEFKITVSNILPDFNDIQFTLESINLSPKFPVGAFKNDLANLTFTGRTREIIQKLREKYSLSYLEDWAFRHEALGLTKALSNDRFDETKKFALKMALKGSQSLVPLTQAVSVRILAAIISNNFATSEALALLQQLNTSTNPNLQRELFFLAKALVIQRIGLSEIERIAKQNITSNNSILKAYALDIYAELAVQEEYRIPALKAAEESISNQDPMISSATNLVFYVLITYNFGIESGFKLAKTEITSPLPEARQSATQLLRALINQNVKIQEITSLAKELLQSDSASLKISALSIYLALAQKNLETPECLRAANLLAYNPDPNIQAKALEIFSNLIKNRIGIEEAKRAIEHASSSTNENILSLIEMIVRSISDSDPQWELALAEKLGSRSETGALLTAINLLSPLVYQKTGLELALKVAQKAINSSDIALQRKGLDLLCRLVKQDTGLPEALAVTQKFSNSIAPSIQSARLNLLVALASRNIAIPETLRTLQKIIDTGNSNQQASALSSFGSLAENDIFLEEALAATQKLAKSTDSYLQNHRLDLLGILVGKNIGIPEALQAAQQGIANSDPSRQRSALSLLNTLVGKDIGIQEALGATQKLAESKDSYLQEDRLNLLSSLAQKGVGIKEAFKAIQKNLQNPELQRAASYALNGVLGSCSVKDPEPICTEAILATEKLIAEGNTQVSQWRVDEAKRYQNQ
ncbi:MAG: PEP/pyruvate-binding domain-containing protein [Myxococcaceae bacterium]